MVYQRQRLRYYLNVYNRSLSPEGIDLSEVSLEALHILRRTWSIERNVGIDQPFNPKKLAYIKYADPRGLHYLVQQCEIAGSFRCLQAYLTWMRQYDITLSRLLS
jgi:hypothetical protein